MRTLTEIYGSEDIAGEIEELLQLLHKEGPSNPRHIEQLTYFKIFHPKIFELYEEKIVTVLGLFYKNLKPKSLITTILLAFGKSYKYEYDEYLTPVQASIRRAIEKNKYISISAPTSAGKSYAIRDYIKKTEDDCVIVVPSRALIAEYVSTMKRTFENDKSVMILPFVDFVFQKRSLRRIFILTPERARELFSYSRKEDLSLFFFDEAHISEEEGRGVIFDSLVQRITKHFPTAKMIFAHPFVENPEAQLKKHNLNKEESFDFTYKQNTVGKSFVYQHSNKKDYYFSPYIDKGHLINKCVEFPGGFEKFAFNGENNLLIYSSKASIYDGKYIAKYSAYIEHLPNIIDQQGLNIIKQIESIIGANLQGHDSLFVKLIKKGVVIHHGSVPLEVRFLIEDFIRLGLSKICFATSTLAQGVNMPFDIIILDNMRMNVEGEAERALAFKNLIGRSGRLTNELKFDFGYVYTTNPKLVFERLNFKYHISEESLLQSDLKDLEKNDDSEFIESIVLDSFDDQFNLPLVKVDRLSNEEIQKYAKNILSLVFVDEKVIVEVEYRIEVIEYFKKIYEASLNRDLYEGEYEVFKNAMFILFNIILKKSFKEIVAARYRYFISNKPFANFSQPAKKLPSMGLTKYSLFPDNTPIENVSYDIVVYDTYDYMDQVLSFSLLDTFIATFSILYQKEGNLDALKMINMLRYNTDDSVSIWLMRYGIPIEHIEMVAEYIEHIDEKNIVFDSKIYDADTFLRSIVEWYLPIDFS